MSETNNSVVNVGEIAKPVDTFIKKVSKGFGQLWEPYQITRVAKAEAAANLVRAQNEIAITDLHRRAIHRFVEEEARNQKNLEDVVSKAATQISDSAKPDEMDDDWIANFFDKCKIISDQEMQNLWARILAGEANAPGKFSRRTVNFLGDLDKADADHFVNLLGFVAQIGASLCPLVFDVRDPIYVNAKMPFPVLAHLESIGLVRFDPLAGFRLHSLGSPIKLFFYGTDLRLTFERPENNELEIGKVVFTKIGAELAPVCAKGPASGFLEHLKERWKKHLEPAQEEATAS
jgi:hypothetical protein